MQIVAQLPLAVRYSMLTLWMPVSASEAAAVRVTVPFTDVPGLLRETVGGVQSAAAPIRTLFVVCEVKTAWAALGNVDYGRKSSEQGNVKFRRSLYFVKDLQAGDVVTPGSIRSVRPGFGAAPKLAETLIGKRLKIAVTANTPAFSASA